MSSLTLLQSLHENLAGRAQVKSVFGDPVTAGEKTIIPVAKIAYGFGAGAGTGGMGDTKPKGAGGGGGEACARFPSAYSKSARERQNSSPYMPPRRHLQHFWPAQQWDWCLPGAGAL